MKKTILFLLITYLFLSCGTTGRVVFYDFDASKYVIEQELFSVINKDSEYVVPAKWKAHMEGDYFERIYIYFKSNPEELYQIGFACDSATWKVSNQSRLGLISIYQGDQFKYDVDLSRQEKERIQKRLEDEILSKIQSKYVKDNTTKSCY